LPIGFRYIYSVNILLSYNKSMEILFDICFSGGGGVQGTKQLTPLLFVKNLERAEIWARKQKMRSNSKFKTFFLLVNFERKPHPLVPLLKLDSTFRSTLKFCIYPFSVDPTLLYIHSFRSGPILFNIMAIAVWLFCFTICNVKSNIIYCQTF